MQYLYNDGHSYTFMDIKSYEQVEVQKEIMEDAAKWILENAVCEVSFWGDRVISVTAPTFVDLLVKYTEPAVRGDTANNVTKKATLETGAEIDVPLFIEAGMKLKIDTRNGEYLQRST
jgi:elongation factor P